MKLQLNDCIADPEGRLLAGSCFYNPSTDYPIGKVFCVQTNGRVQILDEGFHLANGLGFSPGGKTLYFAHSRLYYDSDYVRWEPELYTGGITGVYAEELTREAVFDAIRNRRCYATTGKRVIVDFKADDHWMGEEYKSTNAPHISVKVTGTGPLASVTVVKNNQDYLRVEGRGRHELEFEYGKTEPPGETDYYYVRVIQRITKMAWASPIWISRP